MATTTVAQLPLSLWMLASSRRFIRWLTRPYVILSLIMLSLMFIMVIVPLVRMVRTTFTWQLHDLTRVPDADVGGFTLFHWVRMLTGTLGKIFLYTPLQHSLVIAAGASVLALVIGGSMAWLLVRTDMPGRRVVNQLALLPYIMPSWTLAQAWLLLFKNRLSGGTPGLFEYVVGISSPNWLAYNSIPKPGRLFRDGKGTGLCPLRAESRGRFGHAGRSFLKRRDPQHPRTMPGGHFGAGAQTAQLAHLLARLRNRYFRGQFLMAEKCYRPQMLWCDMVVDTTGAAIWATPEIAEFLRMC